MWRIKLAASEVSLPVLPSGIVIGRSPECEIIVDEEHVSRRHALLRVVGVDLQLEALGRNPVIVNGAAVQKATLRSDDEVVVGGTTMRVVAVRDTGAVPLWVADYNGALFGIARLPYTVGGADDDDLCLPGWPGAAVTLQQVRGAMFVAVDAEGVELDGTAVAAGAIEPLAPGARIMVAGQQLTLRHDALAEASTRSVLTLPDRIEILIYPRKAEVVVGYGAFTRNLVISERRVELLCALVAPPAPHVPGGFVADGDLISKVWPGSDRANQGDLNALVHRLRRDFVKAGLDGPALITRLPGGGGTRFSLLPTAHVTIRNV